MKFLQKLIATLTILALLLSPSLNIVTLRPKSVKALDAGGSWANVIKEIVLDAIGWAVSDQIIKPLERRIMNWGLGKNTDSNEPFPVLDWSKFFGEALDVASAKFINKFNLTLLCSPIKISLGNMPQFSLYYSEVRNYQYYAACTLDRVVGNVEQFFQNPQIGFYGPNAWLELTKPQNNIYGAWMLARAERERMLAEGERNADKETAVSEGIKNETATTKTDTEACKDACYNPPTSGGKSACEQNCDNQYDGCIMTAPPGDRQCEMQRALCYNNCPPNLQNPTYTDVQQCVQKCEVNSGKGLAIVQKIKNLGSHINTQLKSSMTADMQRIISADEISELLGIIFSALLNKAMSGVSGLLGSIRQNTSTPVQRNRLERQDTFSYQRAFKKEQTSKDISKVRSETVTGIMKAIQQLDRSIIACKEDEMMPYTDWTKNIADILGSYVESLYVGLEGLNLKPDFEVLDSRFAPYTVYGYSWGEVPAVKIPDRCREVINQYFTETLGQQTSSLNTTCQNIQSGLEPITPTRAWLEQVAQSQDPPRHTSWTSDPSGSCSQCVYDHDQLNCPPPPLPPQPYPRGANPVELWTDLIHQQKGEFWWACKGQYNIITNLCNECLKKVDEKCDQNDPRQKNECIMSQCGNYESIATQIVNPLPTPVTGAGALNFYNRCLIEERKESCYTCLKEYYMPSVYCTDIADYIARSIDKYPAVVKRVRAGGDDKGEIWGPAQQDILARGDQCDDNYDAQPMNLSLLCRIMPEFTFGGLSCRSACMGRGMTEEQLRDITDFRPNDIDCNWATVNNGGRNPGNPINDGTLRVKGKCCATFWVHDLTNYSICAGAASGTTPTSGLCAGASPQIRPQCFCEEGERYLADAKTTGAGLPGFVCPDPQGCGTGGLDTCRRGCNSDTFTVPSDMTNINAVIIRTNAAPGGSIITISPIACNDADESSCWAVAAAKQSLLNWLAKIFKPLMPFSAYAQVGPCDCNTSADCARGEICRITGSGCTSISGISVGICQPIRVPGTCNCNVNSDCQSGWYCDAEAATTGDCDPGTTGRYTGLCLEAAVSPGSCDYIVDSLSGDVNPSTDVPATSKRIFGGTSLPNDGICQYEIYNSTNSEGCCSSTPTDRVPQIGNLEMICDLSGYNQLSLSVVSNDMSDCKTHATVCAPCNPSDPNYPYYGTSLDQCRNKIPDSQR